MCMGSFMCEFINKYKYKRKHVNTINQCDYCREAALTLGLSSALRCVLQSLGENKEGEHRCVSESLYLTAEVSGRNKE